MLSRILLPVMLLAQAVPTDAPTIPLSLEVEYFRADDLVQRLKPDWELANADLENAVAALRKVCGEKFSVAAPTRQNRHLTCAPVK